MGPGMISLFFSQEESPAKAKQSFSSIHTRYLPVERPPGSDGLWEVVNQGGPATSSTRHGEWLWLLGLRNSQQPARVGRNRVIYRVRKTSMCYFQGEMIFVFPTWCLQKESYKFRLVKITFYPSHSVSMNQRINGLELLDQIFSPFIF